MGGILRLDPSSGRVLRVIHGAHGLGWALAATRHAIWVAGPDTFPQGHPEKSGVSLRRQDRSAPRSGRQARKVALDGHRPHREWFFEDGPRARRPSGLEFQQILKKFKCEKCRLSALGEGSVHSHWRKTASGRAAMEGFEPAPVVGLSPPAAAVGVAASAQCEPHGPIWHLASAAGPFELVRFWCINPGGARVSRLAGG
jgi:hypothetical protein